MLEHDLVLKSDELYLVGDMSTDQSGERAGGLYARDTRYLSRFDITLNGAPLERFNVRVLGPASAHVVLANPLLTLPDGATVFPHTVALEEFITLSDHAEVRYVLRNFGQQALTLTLAMDVASDFRDLFDIRGFPRKERGKVQEPVTERDCIVLGYVALDDARTETVVSFDQPAATEAAEPALASATANVVLLPGYDLVAASGTTTVPPAATATFTVTLPPHGIWQMTARVVPKPAAGGPLSARAMVEGGHTINPATITTDSPFFNRFLERCASDLEMLQTTFPVGSLPAAGIPWYVAPFGRDSLIVGLQTLPFMPSAAESTLRVLAAYQGTKVDSWRDEEPGKILHEIRYGEMARRGEVPHTPYYGSVDSTPLFVLLFAETVAWTGNDSLYRDLLPNVKRALEWIERYGDADGDGFVEFRSGSTNGVRISQQGWKDSFDSLNTPAGKPVEGTIALVEVQGYVYAAYQRLAAVARNHGDAGWADELEQRAHDIQDRVEAVFWMEPEGYYAQALDNDKQLVRTIASNAGHLLFCGVPSPERAAAVAKRLQQPDMDSGWGIRTLSAKMVTYNPMSYHNGSVWPHDNSLIIAGLRRYDQTAEAGYFARCVIDAALTDPLYRLPELYCGFARTASASDAPVAYPVSCSPQAWAAGAGELLVRSMLGLELNDTADCLLVDPQLPGWLNEVTILNLRVLGVDSSLTVRRDGAGYRVVASGPIRLANAIATTPDGRQTRPWVQAVTP